MTEAEKEKLEIARKDAEEKEKKDAEEKARKDAEEKARKDAEEQAREDKRRKDSEEIPAWADSLVKRMDALEKRDTANAEDPTENSEGKVIKDAQPAELLAAVRVVASGDAVVAPSVTRRLLDAYAHRLVAPGEDPSQVLPAEQHAALALLTAREREVLMLVARGLSNAEIAGTFVLSEATVKSHVGHILAKLELRDRVQIVVFAYEHGLVVPAGG